MLMRSKHKILFLIILMISVVCVGFVGFDTEVIYAADRKANITCTPGNWVAARSGPGTEYAIEHKLSNGKDITVIDESKGADGKTWYKIKYNLIVDNSECVSYVRSDFVDFSGETQAQPPSTVESTSSVYATGVINGVNVYVRNAAGTSGTTKIVSLDRGHTVDIIGQTTVSGVVWYNVTGTKNGTPFSGWTISTYINVTYNGVSDTDYANSLRSAGFPESYINNLVALHTRYPNWKFEPVKVNLDWNTVISNESKNGLNLISKSADDSKKSTAAGAYNWDTNTWTEYETGWVSVSPEYLAYVMDPRNFLDDTNIFQFLSLSYSANENLSGVQNILKGSFMEGTKTYSNETINYSQTVLDSAKSSGVSAYHLASRLRQEQGVNGTSPLISGTYSGYEGYYNFFNFRAYGSTKDIIYRNGLSYAKTQGWNTRAKSISGGASLIGANYINKGQNTLYFQKFNVVNTSNLYGHQYMANVQAAISEAQNTAKGYSDKNQNFTFRIPVYNNMPASAVTFGASGNPNNYLKSLSVSGVAFTPGFSGANTSYSAVVPNSTSSVNISASAVTSTSTVSGTGTYTLSVGNNVIKVNCKAKSGSVRTYTITINRQAAANTTPSTPDTPQNPPLNQTNYTVTSNKYSVGEYITGIAPGTTASTFLSNISSNGTVKLLTSGGTENKGKVGTGNKVVVYDQAGKLQRTYEVVIYGDVTEDGNISIKDLIAINRHILNKSKVSGCKLMAADASKDGKVSIKDMIVINNSILGKSSIKQ